MSYNLPIYQSCPKAVAKMVKSRCDSGDFTVASANIFDCKLHLSILDCLFQLFC